LFWRLRTWLKAGGMIVTNAQLKAELLSIKFKRNLKGKIVIMPKEQMKREGLKSPNKADAFSLTFYKEYENIKKDKEIEEQLDEMEEEELYPGLGV